VREERRDDKREMRFRKENGRKRKLCVLVSCRREEKEKRRKEKDCSRKGREKKNVGPKQRPKCKWLRFITTIASAFLHAYVRVYCALLCAANLCLFITKKEG